MEFFDIYNIDRALTGRHAERNDHLPAGEYRLVIHVSIFNSEQKMLIQQRKSDDRHWSDMWDISVGGCALTGETSRQAAHRETLEELGIDIDFEGVRPFITVNYKYGFDDEYIVLYDRDISSDNIQKSEIAQIKWADLNQICSMIDTGEFIPYHKEFITLMFKNAYTKAPDIIQP